MGINKSFEKFNSPTNGLPGNARTRQRGKRSGHRGATVGDAIRSSVKTAGGIAVLTLLVQCGPMLLAGIVGCLFVFRSCTWSSTPLVPGPSMMAMQPAAMPAQSPVFTNSLAAPRSLPGNWRQRIADVPQAQPVAVQSPLENQVPLRDNDLQAFPSPYADSPVMPGFSFPYSGFTPQTIPSPAFAPSTNPMMGVIAEAPTAFDAPSFESSPLFDMRRGRKFTGTSQMPGEPSIRISLSLGAIRDRGSNITARLSALDGPRVTKAYKGLIEQNPPRLTLIPEMNPGSFGTFVTYMPWHSNSPTRITLELSADAKTLSGTSGSGEQFELLPEIVPTRIASQVTVSEAQREFDGFDDASPGSMKWRLVRRNEKPVDDQFWVFTQSSNGSGQFEWISGNSTLGGGTYRESRSRKHLDVVLMVKGVPQDYSGLYMPMPGSQGGLQVCIPATAGDKRPTRISSKYGNTFELVPVDDEQRESS